MRYGILHNRSNYGTPDQGLTLGRLWYPTSHGLDNDVDLGSLLVYAQGAAVLQISSTRNGTRRRRLCKSIRVTWLVQRVDPGVLTLVVPVPAWCRSLL